MDGDNRPRACGDMGFGGSCRYRTTSSRGTDFLMMNRSRKNVFGELKEKKPVNILFLMHTDLIYKSSVQRLRRITAVKQTEITK